MCTAEVDACKLSVAEAVQGGRGRGVSNLSSLETAENVFLEGVSTPEEDLRKITQNDKSI